MSMCYYHYCICSRLPLQREGTQLSTLVSIMLSSRSGLNYRPIYIMERTFLLVAHPTWLLLHILLHRW